MQGIKTTKYGAHQIRASCKAKTVIVTKDDALNHDEHHRQAAIKLASLMGWHGRWVSCTVPGVDGVVWANTGEKLSERIFEVAPLVETYIEPYEPEEGDITTSDDWHWYQYGKLYLTGDETNLVVKMDQDKLWPNVWRVDDHGGYTLIRVNLTEGKKT